MFAKDLARHVNRLLWLNETAEENDKRMESLRSYGQLPRGRENAGVRLSNHQVANVLMGFVPAPGWAGHAAVIQGDLRPVGGEDASFKGAKDLRDAIASILASDEACRQIISLTFTTEKAHDGDHYRAMLLVQEERGQRRIFFVSHMASSLLRQGAEQSYDEETLHRGCARQLLVGRDVLMSLRREVEMARHWNAPLKTDYQEYSTEEKRHAFHKSLGARPSSKFLNLQIDGAVGWPMEPSRIMFAGHHFVLFPRTKTHARSISIDLTHEKLTMETATTLINRFLSLLTWCDRQHAVLGFGWAGNPVPMPVTRSEIGGTLMQTWILDRELPDDPDLLQRLAYYREGHNAHHAGLVTFEVLSFFKVFESRATSQRGKPNPTKAWIMSVFDDVEANLQDHALEAFEADRGEKSVSEYVFENCRVATAHTSENFPSDADSSLEIRRLHSAATIIHALARHYLTTVHGLSDSRLG